MRSLLTVALLLSFSGLGAHAVQLQTAQDKLRQVRKIYVGDMGTTDEAARFRLLLQDQLAERGFTVVDEQGDADAVLTGVLSVRVLDDGSHAHVYVRLETPGGERLWGRDFGQGKFRHLLSMKEPVRRRAEDVARTLREDLKKAGR